MPRPLNAKPTLSFQVELDRKRDLERRAAEYGAVLGKPTSLSDYIRAALEAFDDSDLPRAA